MTSSVVGNQVPVSERVPVNQGEAQSKLSCVANVIKRVVEVNVFPFVLSLVSLTVAAGLCVASVVLEVPLLMVSSVAAAAIGSVILIISLVRGCREYYQKGVVGGEDKVATPSIQEKQAIDVAEETRAKEPERIVHLKFKGREIPKPEQKDVKEVSKSLKDVKLEESEEGSISLPEPLSGASCDELVEEIREDGILPGGAEACREAMLVMKESVLNLPKTLEHLLFGSGEDVLLEEGLEESVFKKGS